MAKKKKDELIDIDLINPTTEIEIIETKTPVPVLLPELVEVVEKSELSLTTAQAIAFKFLPLMQDINELSKDLTTISKINPTKQEAETARKNRLAIVKKRTAAKDLKAEEKESILLVGKHIDALYNLCETTANLSESEYLKIEKFEINRLAEEKTKLCEERKTALSGYTINTAFYDLENMPVEQFDELVKMLDQNVKAQKVLDDQKLQKEKQDAIDAEILKQKQADDLKKEQDAAKIVTRRMQDVSTIGMTISGKNTYRYNYSEDVFVTIEDLKTLSDEAFKSKLHLLTSQVNVLKNAEKAKADKLKKDAETARLEKLKTDKLLEDEKEKTNIFKKKLDEQKIAADKIEADKKAKDEALLNGTDKVKVRALFDSLKSIQVPQMESAIGKVIGTEVKESIDIILKHIILQSKKLL